MHYCAAASKIWQHSVGFLILKALLLPFNSTVLAITATVLIRATFLCFDRSQPIVYWNNNLLQSIPQQNIRARVCVCVCVYIYFVVLVTRINYYIMFFTSCNV
jgi:hypothetical protein